MGGIIIRRQSNEDYMENNIPDTCNNNNGDWSGGTIYIQEGYYLKRRESHR